PFGVKGVGFTDGLDEQKIRSAAERARADGRIAMIFIETPSNPMNSLVDIALVRRIAEDIAQGSRPIVCCDNTLLGPVFQSPLQHGADLSLYSLTKYVGGHSDLTGGAILGSAAHPTQKLMERQSSSAGSTFSFDVKGDQADAFAFLNRLQVFKLAVSLGG